MAAASGLTWALTVVGLRSLGRAGSGRPNQTLSAVSLGNALAALATLPLALPVAALSWTDFGVVSYLGLAQIGLAYVFLSRAVPHIPAFEITTVLLLEPVLNPVWTWMVHGETPGQGALAGGVIILVATAVNTWLQNR
jgi:drug/metabolite transporter (DMT)-like permease